MSLSIVYKPHESLDLSLWYSLLSLELRKIHGIWVQGIWNSMSHEKFGQVLWVGWKSVAMWARYYLLEQLHAGT